MSKLPWRVPLASVALIAGGVCFAQEPIPQDTALNPETLHIEAVYTIDGTDGGDIRHIEEVSDHEHLITVISEALADETEPRIDIGDGGNTFITWWSSDGAIGDQIQIARRTSPVGPFLIDALDADPDDDARSHPEVAVNDTVAWIAYEAERDGESWIVAGSIQDKPDPFFLDSLFEQETDYAGDRELLVEAADGEVWISWVESDIALMWTVWDETAGAWDVPRYFLYGIMGMSVEDARDCIAGFVQGETTCD